jgi:hypothetical protein
MGFKNPPIGGTTLVRKSIKSNPFVTGTTGWSVNKDGSAEFNNLVIRNGQIVSGTALYYNGTPAKGSLFCAIAAAAGTDAFGNVYGQGFNVGVWSATTGLQAQHFGIDLNGKVYVVNPSAKTVNFIDTLTGALLTYNSSGQSLGNLIVSIAPVAGTDSTGNAYPQGLNVTTGTISGTTFSGTNFLINSSGSFFYSSTPAHGNLIASITSASGTDGFSNAYYPGICTYQHSGTTVTFISQIYNGQLQVGTPAGFAGTGGAFPASVQLGTNDGVLTIAPGGTSGTDTPVPIISLLSPSNNATQPVVSLSQPLLLCSTLTTPQIPSVSASQAQLFTDAGGYPRVQASATGDTNAYSLGEVHLHATAVPQTISSTTGVIVTGLSCTVGIGTYHIHARIMGTVGATAGGQNVNITGPAVSAGQATCISFGAASTVIGVSNGGISANLPTGAFAAGHVFVSTIDAWFTFTASGTLSLQAGEGTSLDTWTVNDGMMDVSPAS